MSSWSPARFISKAVPSALLVLVASLGAGLVLNVSADDHATVVEGRYIVELKGKPLADVSDASEERQRSALNREKADFRDQAVRRKLQFNELRDYSYVMNGIAVEADADTASRLGALPMVQAVHPVYQFSVDEMSDEGEPVATRETVTVTRLTGVPEAHAAGYTGEGVTACIIDSGIDYNHPALGGPGFPNDRVIGGWDFVSDSPDPFDGTGTGQGHGTHVAGILAGSDGNMVGVAPDARIISYKVFGQGAASGGSDIIMAAMERAIEDDCDVVNMSLGTTRGAVIQKAPIVKAVDRMQQRGIVPVIAMGNAAAGPFLPSSPAVAKKSIAVASSGGELVSELAFRVGDELIVPFLLAYPGVPTPGFGSYELVNYGPADCADLAADAFSGQIVLVQRGKYLSFTCHFAQVDILAGAGAAAVVWYDEPRLPIPYYLERFANNMVHYTSPGLTIPVARIRAMDVPDIEALIGDASAELHWGEYVSVPNVVAGEPVFDTTWGPSHELDFKPEVMAPGGYIFSTYPMARGIYSTLSGTSMASPHIAGVVALMKSANPQLKGQHARDILMNTATPVVITAANGETGLGPAALQGAGMVNAWAAINATLAASPAKLAMGDLNGSTYSAQITVTNNGSEPDLLEVSHEPAISAAPPMTRYWTPMGEGSTVTFSTSSVEIEAGGQVTVTAWISEPAGVPDGTIISGWLVFTSVTTGETVRVPYMGLKGDYHELPVMNPTFTDINPSLQAAMLRPEAMPNCSGPPWMVPPCCRSAIPGACGPSIGPSTPVVMDLTNESRFDDVAFITLSQGFPMLRKYRARVFDAKGKTIGYAREFPNGPLLDSREYWVRVSGAGTGLHVAIWDGTLENGEEAPTGTYRIMLEFHKLLGEGDDMPPDYEDWMSPEITIIRD